MVNRKQMDLEEEGVDLEALLPNRVDLGVGVVDLETKVALENHKKMETLEAVGEDLGLGEGLEKVMVKVEEEGSGLEDLAREVVDLEKGMIQAQVVVDLAEVRFWY